MFAQGITRKSRVSSAVGRAGDPVAPGNIAAEYRAAGARHLAYQWWRRAASDGNGDALVEVGYCLHYGIGVRRNLSEAIAAYRAASRATGITPYGREEALYHLAVVRLDRDGARRGRRSAIASLRAAATDGDYPAASALLEALVRGAAFEICRCRRGLKRALGGQAHCTRIPGVRADGLTSACSRRRPVQS